MSVFTLHTLNRVIENRKGADPEKSYTARLVQGGDETILAKIEEEAGEVLAAARQEGDRRIIEETADLFYHVLVLLAARGLSLGDVERELASRHAGD